MSAGSWDRLRNPTVWKHAAGLRGFYSATITRDEALALAPGSAARFALEQMLLERTREDPDLEGLLMFVVDDDGHTRVGFCELTVDGSELRWNGPRLR